MGEFQSNPGLSPDSIMRFSTNPGLPFKQVLRSPAGASQKKLLRIGKTTVSSMGRGARAARGSSRKPEGDLYCALWSWRSTAGIARWRPN